MKKIKKLIASALAVSLACTATFGCISMPVAADGAGFTLKLGADRTSDLAVGDTVKVTLTPDDIIFADGLCSYDVDRLTFDPEILSFDASKATVASSDFLIGASEVSDGEIALMVTDNSALGATLYNGEGVATLVFTVIAEAKETVITFASSEIYGTVANETLDTCEGAGGSDLKLTFKSQSDIPVTPDTDFTLRLSADKTEELEIGDTVKVCVTPDNIAFEEGICSYDCSGLYFDSKVLSFEAFSMEHPDFNGAVNEREDGVLRFMVVDHSLQGSALHDGEGAITLEFKVISVPDIKETSISLDSQIGGTVFNNTLDACEGVAENTLKLTFNGEIEYFSYEIVDGGAVITDAHESLSGKVIVPDTLGGYPVIGIGDNAFDALTEATDFDLPDTVTYIGKDAFVNTAFYNSDWPIQGLYIENRYLIKVHENVGGVFYVESYVSVVAEEAFTECHSLEGVNIAANVTNIGDNIIDFSSHPDFKIYGERDTAAEDYAENNNCRFFDILMYEYFNVDEDAMTAYLPDDNTTVGSIPFELQDKDGNIVADSELVGTGMQVINSGEAYAVILMGDTSGDGQVNSTDFMQIRRVFLELYEMNDIQSKAADVTGDGQVNSTDFTQIRRHFLALFDLHS